MITCLAIFLDYFWGKQTEKESLVHFVIDERSLIGVVTINLELMKIFIL